MKNIFKFIGIVTTFLLITLTILACDKDNDDSIDRFIRLV